MKKKRQKRRRHIIIFNNIKPSNKKVRAQAKKELGEVNIFGWHVKAEYKYCFFSFDGLIFQHDFYICVDYSE